MNIYGLRIGSVGLEFPSREDRDKAIVTFTHSSAVRVENSAGLRYRPGEKEFSTYERDNAVVQANCNKCKGVFTTETCQEREVPRKDWNGKFEDGDATATMWLCDGCYAQWMQDKKVHDAKATVAAASTDAA
jgi:hypothetical protein